MNIALEEAEKAWGRTSPNPMVGAVLVKDGEEVSRGYHHKAGEPHAEINAIRSAGEDAAGSVIYVTLEPCSTFGRTPPCTQAIIDAGINKVVIGSLDPNPNHAGAAVKVLNEAGIEVISGCEEERCLKLNEGFFHWITTGKPFVILKMAMTLDGKIATKDGCSQWITGEVARNRVQRIRQYSDAIMVGGETARKDAPSLNVRSESDWQQPRRIIISSSIKQNDAASILKEGVEPEVYSPETDHEWNELLTQLGSENITVLLVEGGGELAATMLKAGVIDKVEFHIAPKILGGRDSRPVVGGENPMKLAEAIGLDNVSVENLGNDIGITGYTNK